MAPLARDGWDGGNLTQWEMFFDERVSFLGSLVEMGIYRVSGIRKSEVRGRRSDGREDYAVAMTALMAVFISSNTVGDTAPVFLKKRFVDTDLDRGTSYNAPVKKKYSK